MRAAVRGAFRNPLLPLRVVLAAVLLVSASETRSDADLWGHVLFGRATIAAKALAHTDPYSFTSDQPWIDHEWASEALMGAAYQIAGPSGLIALRTGVVMLALALVLTALRGLRGYPLLHDVTIAAYLIGIHAQTTQVRPQLFSILFFTVLLLLFERARTRGLRGLVAVPFLMLVWVNCHGGWIVGAAMLVLWSACEAVARIRRGESVLPLALLGGASITATLVNPYGFEMLSFLHATVGLGRPDIQEWRPLYQLGVAYVGHWIFVASFAAFVLWRSRAYPTVRQALMLATLAVVSCMIMRIIGFFAAGAVLLLLPQLDRLAAAYTPSAPARPRGAVVVALWAVAVAAVVVAATRVVANETCITMLDDVPEADLVAYVRAHDLRGRLLVDYNWGEYAIWHLYPALRVSFDGRGETVYSERFMRLHAELYAGTETGMAYLDTLSPDYAWLPRWRPLVNQLTARGWTPLYSGPTSVLLARRPIQNDRRVDVPATGRRCFPGP